MDTPETINQDMHTIKIHSDAYERLQRHLLALDKDPNAPRAFTEGEVVELALHILETTVKCPKHLPLYLPFNAGVAYFEQEREQRVAGENHHDTGS